MNVQCSYESEFYGEDLSQMKIYDISQEVFNGRGYPGDPLPTSDRIYKMEEGSYCNVTTFSMCTHNGTHIDAPYHFYEKGKTIDKINLDHCVGLCTVIGSSTNEYKAIQEMLEKGYTRILLKGEWNITIEIGKLLNQHQAKLIGVESQSVGPINSPMEVHLELLGQGVVLLEGLVLNNVEPGEYYLVAAPINLGGSDGAPCRAILLEEIKA